MTDRPEDKSRERRGSGPLGGEGEETKEAPQEQTGGGEGEATRQIPSRGAGEEGEATRRTRRSSRRTGEEGGEEETRAVRTPGGQGTHEAESTYPRGYFEAAEERESRLRDMYGGVDWLGSFLGFVFSLVAGGFLFLVAGLILIPLGFSLNLGEGSIGPAMITGLVVVGIILFLTYFFGGYVAGRLARFDGGRNGAMTVLWSLVVMVLVAVVGGFLPGGLSDQLRDFIQNGVGPAIGGLLDLEIAGIVILAAVLLIAILGGFAGGRMGSRYHSEIDRTT